jgi:hypothetical protein
MNIETQAKAEIRIYSSHNTADIFRAEAKRGNQPIYVVTPNTMGPGLSGPITAEAALLSAVCGYLVIDDAQEMPTAFIDRLATAANIPDQARPTIVINFTVAPDASNLEDWEDLLRNLAPNLVDDLHSITAAMVPGNHERLGRFIIEDNTVHYYAPHPTDARALRDAIQSVDGSALEVDGCMVYAAVSDPDTARDELEADGYDVEVR